MSFWAAAQRAYHVATETRGAVTAAQTTLAAGGSPFAALRAFADATEGTLDDATVAVLERGMRDGIVFLERATAGLAWVVAHDQAVQATTQRVINAALDLGYQAGRLRALLRLWLEEAETDGRPHSGGPP